MFGHLIWGLPVANRTDHQKEAERLLKQAAPDDTGHWDIPFHEVEVLLSAAQVHAILATVTQ